MRTERLSPRLCVAGDRTVSLLTAAVSQSTSMKGGSNCTRLLRVTVICWFAGCSVSTQERLSDVGETVGIATT